LDLESAEPVQEKKEKDDEDDEELDESAGPVDEVVEVNESDLVEALADALKEVRSKYVTSEAKVSKSFGEPSEVREKKGTKGLADEKAGQHPWNDEKPPAAQDWTVKESVYRKKIAGLVNELNQYKGAYGKLLESVKETNLFNAKLIYTNRVLQNSNLGQKDRLDLIEMFDTAKSKNDVELIYNTFTKSLAMNGVVGESSRKLQRASRLTPPSSTVLREQMKRESKESDDGEEPETLTEHWQRLSGLAGILKD